MVYFKIHIGATLENAQLLAPGNPTDYPANRVSAPPQQGLIKESSILGEYTRAYMDIDIYIYIDIHLPGPAKSRECREQLVMASSCRWARFFSDIIKVSKRLPSLQNLIPPRLRDTKDKGNGPNRSMPKSTSLRKSSHVDYDTEAS